MAATGADRREGDVQTSQGVVIGEGMAPDQHLDICRVCLGTGLVLRSLFIVDEAQISPSDKAMSLASVKMDPGDGLPSQICSNCYEKLESAYKFKLQVEQADNVLHERHVLLNIKEELFFGDASLSIHRHSGVETEESFMSHDIDLLKNSQVNISLEPVSKGNIQHMNVVLASHICNERGNPEKERENEHIQGKCIDYIGKKKQENIESCSGLPPSRMVSQFDHQQTEQDSQTVLEQQTGIQKHIETEPLSCDVQNFSLENQEFHSIILDREENLKTSEDDLHRIGVQQFAMLEHDYVTEIQLVNVIPDKEKFHTKHSKCVHQTNYERNNDGELQSSPERICQPSEAHDGTQKSSANQSISFDEAKTSQKEFINVSKEGNYSVNLSLSSKTKQNQEDGSEISHFVCHMCDRYFISEAALNDHMVSHEEMKKILTFVRKSPKKLVKVVDGSANAKANLSALETTSKREETNICFECGEEYLCLISFNKHMKQHEREKELEKNGVSLENPVHEGDNSLDSQSFHFNPPENFVNDNDVKEEVKDMVDQSDYSESKIYAGGSDNSMIDATHRRQSGQFLEVAFSEHDLCNSIEVSALQDLAEKAENIGDSNSVFVNVKEDVKVLNPSGLAMSTSHEKSSFCSVERNSEIDYVCKECCQTFSSENELHSHIEEHVAYENLQNSICTQCNETFDDDLSLKNHLVATSHKTLTLGQNCDQSKRVKRVAAKAAEKIIDSIRTDITSDEEDDDELYQLMYQKDKRIAFDEEECETSEKGRKRKNSAKRKSRSAKPIHCLLCNEKCPSRRALAEHLDTHVKVESDQGVSKTDEYQEIVEFEGDVDFDDDDDDDDDDDFAGGLGWPMENHECPICGKGYSTRKSLMRHQLLHEEPHFECDICSAKFYRKDKLKAHYDKCAEKNPDQVRKCNICGDSFENNEILKEHRAKHVAEGILTEDDLTDTEHKSDEKPPRKRRTDITGLECTDCNKSYTSRKGLLRHIQVHEGKKYLCDMCPKKFYTKEQLKIHVAKHNIVKPYKCPRCPKRFIKEETMNNHAAKHDRPPKKPKESDPPKRFLCEICSKSFTQSTTLIAHLRAHNGIKPYVCSVCSRPFTTNAYLKMHMRTHTQERPYICQHCSRAFARADTLANHLTSHTGEAKYHCKFCPKHFRRLKSLKEHVFIHTGQRPYACPTCDRRFNNNGSRYAHSKRCKQNTQSQMSAQSSKMNQDVFEEQIHAKAEQMNEPQFDQQEIHNQMSEEQEIMQTTVSHAHIVKPQGFKTITITRPDGSLAQHHVMTHQEILMPIILPLHVTLTDANGEMILPEESKIFTA